MALPNAILTFALFVPILLILWAIFTGMLEGEQVPYMTREEEAEWLRTMKPPLSEEEIAEIVEMGR